MENEDLKKDLKKLFIFLGPENMKIVEELISFVKKEFNCDLTDASINLEYYPPVIIISDDAKSFKKSFLPFEPEKHKRIIPNFFGWSYFFFDNDNKEYVECESEYHFLSVKTEGEVTFLHRTLVMLTFEKNKKPILNKCYQLCF